MGDIWYKGVRVEAFAGIPRVELDAVLASAGAPTSLYAVLDRFTELEPLHVARIDQGFNATNTPRILALEIDTVQVDAGINEIPTAVCQIAVGRDATAMAHGVTSAEAVSVAHYIERYLSKFVPVRVYVRSQLTAEEGPTDGDALDMSEWCVLFDGFATGPTRRGSADDYKLTLHLTHFLSVLNYSSSLAGNVAAGTEMPHALSSLLFSGAAGSPAGTGFTNVGYVASTLCPGGEGLYTDFWGFDVPQRGTAVAQGGLKRFLLQLAEQDLFDWNALARADLNATFCPDFDVLRKNDQALAALNRIEPFTAVPFNPGEDAGARWKVLKDAVIAQRLTNTAEGKTLAVDRADIMARARVPYLTSGYVYGVPIPFYLHLDQLNGSLNASVGFAADIAVSSLDSLAPASFWELLSGRYGPRYQLTVAPMADRAIVMPFQPCLSKSWVTIAAGETFEWNDDVRNPVPVRGVVLMSQRKSNVGINYAATPNSPINAAQTTADAAFDSCEPGVFVYRAMPAWLVHAARYPAIYASRSVLGVRAMASVPGTTGAAAAAIVDAIVGNTPAAAAGLTGDLAAAALGIVNGAITAPTEVARSTANRMAKSLFQQTRAQSRNVYLATRFRTDIAPGSMVTMEAPIDNYVRQTLTGQRDTIMTGMVLRMTINLSRESQTASTHFQVGFVRTEAETKSASVMYADAHPFWNTACYGCPWSDSIAVRNRLGLGATIDYRIPPAAGL